MWGRYGSASSKTSPGCESGAGSRLEQLLTGLLVVGVV